jgi:hypothetical protein
MIKSGRWQHLHASANVRNWSQTVVIIVLLFFKIWTLSEKNTFPFPPFSAYYVLVNRQRAAFC